MWIVMLQKNKQPPMFFHGFKNDVEARRWMQKNESGFDVAIVHWSEEVTQPLEKKCQS